MSAETRQAQLREEAVPVFTSGGPLVGIVPCSICGAAIMLGAHDRVDRVAQHHEWHERTGTDG